MRAQQAAAAVAKLELFPLKAAFRYKPHVPQVSCAAKSQVNNFYS